MTTSEPSPVRRVAGRTLRIASAPVCLAAGAYVVAGLRDVLRGPEPPAAVEPVAATGPLDGLYRDGGGGWTLAGEAALLRPADRQGGPVDLLAPPPAGLRPQPFDGGLLAQVRAAGRAEAIPGGRRYVLDQRGVRACLFTHGNGPDEGWLMARIAVAGEPTVQEVFPVESAAEPPLLAYPATACVLARRRGADGQVRAELVRGWPAAAGEVEQDGRRFRVAPVGDAGDLVLVWQTQ